MSSSLDKLKALSARLENTLDKKEEPISTLVSKTPEASIKVKKTLLKTSANIKNTTNKVRELNILRVKELYTSLKIIEKAPDFENIFIYKAMNLSGIGLKENDFGQVRPGKYIQIIAITYEPDKNGKKKAKNISLGYFGKAETLNEELKKDIIEFILCWRYEKAFQNLEHYKKLIEKLKTPSTTLF